MDLNNLAESTGVEEACGKLKARELTVEEISALCAEYRAELEQVKSELARQVSGQVHDATFTSGMLSKAVLEMDAVSGGLSKMTTRCDDVRKSTPGFEQLRRATIAKRNLHSVIEQLDLYGRVPNRVRRLMSELEREPRGDNLRRVFREWLGLSAWRDRVVWHVEDAAARAVLAEERAWRRAQGQVLEHDTPELAEEDARSPSSASLETMLALLKDHFRDSYVLGDRIFEIVMDSATRVLELGRERPSELVLIAEICERRDRLVIREMKRRAAGTSRDLAEEFVSKRAELLTRLGEFADERAAQILHQEGTSSLQSSGLSFEETLGCADGLLNDLHAVARDMRPCFPRYYDVLGVFRKWYEARLTREFSARVHDAVTEAELPSKDMLSMASWIANYCGTIHNYYEFEPVQLDETSFPKDVVGLERLCDNLLERYLTERALPRLASECRSKQDELGFKIVRIDPEDIIEPSEDQHGYLRTDMPDALFELLTQEIEICNKHFAGERTLRFFEEMAKLSTQWFLPEHEKRLRQRSKDEDFVEQICAWISDCHRIQLRVRELFDLAAEGLVRSEDVATTISKASDIVEDTCKLFQDSALAFAKEELIDKRILGDLDSQVMPNCFTKEWEESRYLGARVIVATLEDWFFHATQGLREWIISDFVLGRALLWCLESINSKYCNTLVRWSKRFGSAKRAAGRVEEDAKMFIGFFKRCFPLLKAANAASCRTEGDVDRKFKVLFLLADVLQGDEFNLEPLVEALGSARATRAVVIRLRALRGGRVFNRRQADLDKELPPSDESEGSDGGGLIHDVKELEALGSDVSAFEGGEVPIEEDRQVNSERQIAFVKKIAAFAKSTSFRGSPPHAARVPSPNAKDTPVSVLSMNEFISASKRG